MSDRGETGGETFWADVSEETALRRYRTLVNAVDDGIYQLDAAGRFVAVNDVIVEMTGYSREELLGEHLSLVLGDDDLARIERSIQRRLDAAGERDETFELTAHTAEGKTLPFELRFNPLVENGDFRGTIGIARDISDRKRAERTLSERDHQLKRERDLVERVLETSPVGVMVFDADGTVTRTNERARAILDIGRNERESYAPGDRTTYDEDGRVVPVRGHPFATALEAGEPVYDRVLRVERPDGESRWLSVSAVPMFDEDGEIDRVVTTGEDITGLKERERRLERRTDELATELEEIFARISDAFYALDEEFRFTHVNERAEKMMGRSADEVLERVVWDVFPEAVGSDFYDRYHEAMETQEPVSFERYSEAFGSWIQVNAYPSETGLSVYFRDVTERKERERELEESERRYRTLAEGFPIGIVTLFDGEFRYTLAAGRGFEDIPVDPDDLEGRRLREVWGDRVAETLEPALESALDGEERSVELEYAGREWVVHAVPITDDHGSVLSGMTMAQDITEQKARERYLRDAKSQLEAATEAGAIGTWEWHVSEDRFVAGASFARTFGVDPDAAREGVSIERFASSIHEDDIDRVLEDLEEAMDSCGEYEAEYRVQNADGDLRWVVARGHVECDDEGNSVTFPGALADITERKRAEKALQRHKKQLETLFQVLPVGVVVADADGQLVEANDTAKEIWGGDVFDAENVPEYERYRGWWVDTRERIEPEEWTMSRVLEGEVVTEPDVFEIEAADGDRRIVMIHGMPIENANGEVVRGVITQTDITERREYQRKLEATVDQLEESNERLEQFAYAASHDLQEPLRMISSYLQLISQRYDDALDSDGEEFLWFAIDGADRMREMIEGLLAYSRVDNRGEPLEPVKLDTVLTDVLEDLQVKIAESDAEIAAESLPRVDGDERQLQQVFQNLLANAFEYAGDEPPRVRVSAERAGGMWEISVSDEGIGIDPAETDRIFDVFQRLHSREDHPGTGIGLALCQRIVERHGGEIRVDSAPGEGATFTFTLPTADGPEV